MSRAGPIAAVVLLLASCGSGDDGSAPAPAPAPAAGNEVPAAAPANSVQGASAARWDLQSSGEGAALALPAGSGGTAIRLFCPARQDRLLVNVPAFRPIASEERLSFGSGGDPVALVADVRGDRQRGGVTGAGPVPDNLAALLAGPLSASYGAQRSGPHPIVPPALSRAFVAACGEAAGPARSPAGPPAAAAGPCLTQGSERLRVAPLRAVGTEPFWGARIEGRCVTYSHPEDQAGTRVWTRYTPAPGGGGTWSGALGGRLFELRIRPSRDCSDGMSDRHYPLAAELQVGGERRSGCAEPL